MGSPATTVARWRPQARPGSSVVRLHAVRLDAAALEGDDPNRLRPDAIWIQVAREGTYKGHASGSFTFDAGVFAEIIRNFRAHPAYVAGDDGFGAGDVIPFDFHHESEKPSPHLAVVGAPAAAWALDLEARTSDAGEVQLWCLTRYLEPARSYVLEGKYKWTSIAVWPNASHPVTGETIGWYVSSIAFTNDPFIQGMAPIAATRVWSAAGRRLLEDDIDADFVMSEFRWIFGLTATDGLAEARAELGKLAALAAAPGETPNGVDVAALVGRLRDLLRLPLLTPAAEVFSAATNLLARLDDATPTQQPSSPAPMVAANWNKDEIMKFIALARKLKLAATITNEDEAIEAVIAHCEQLKLEAAANAGARTKLAAIGKLFGVEDPDKVLDAVSSQHADLEALKASVPELAEMLAGQGDDEEKAAAEEVVEAMRAHRLPPQAQPALEMMRTGGVELPKGADGKVSRSTPNLKELLAGRKAARERFLAKYPAPPRAQQHLQAPIATQPAGAPNFGFGPAQSAAYFEQPRAAMPDGAPGHQHPPVLALEAFEGRNDIEKAMNHLRATQPDANKLPHKVLWQRACEVVRTSRTAPLH